MGKLFHQIRKCLNPSCGFRFHNHTQTEQWIYCPKCGSVTDIIEAPYESMIGEHRTTDGLPVYEVVLDNIRSAYNVGSILRTADGTGFSHLHCCGITPTPDNPKVRKTALGAENNIPWTQYWNTLEAVDALIQQGYTLIALEGDQNAVSIFNVQNELSDVPLALIIGNEVSGIDPGALSKCTHKIWLPMLGNKQSFNVSVAFGIAAYLLRFNKDIK